MSFASTKTLRASSREALGDAALILLTRTLVSIGAVRLLSVRAISDDDYARVVIAEAFAKSPGFDPSGTSWLPAPFWLTGAAMAAAGRSLVVARTVAWLLAGVASLLVYFAALRIAKDRRAAFIAAMIATVFPWSARLGVATVPELVTAALLFFGVATLVPRDERDAGARLLGAFAIGLATLSRYEAWPVAAAFAAFTLLDAWRASRAEARAAGRLVLASVAVLLGPVVWMGWNARTHGSSFHFLARVTAYARALPETSSDGPVARFFAYPRAMLRDEPALFLLFAASLGLLFLRDKRGAGDALTRWRRPALLVAFQIGALSLAMLNDAAPTHHPERAVLVGFLLLAAVSGELLARITAAPKMQLPVAVGVAALFALPIGADVVTAQRVDEEAIGELAREAVPPGERLLVETPDYGYFAVVAAFARPESAIFDRSIDPRLPGAPSSFEDAAALRARLGDGAARWVAGRLTDTTRGALGWPIAVRGGWALWRLTPRTPAGTVDAR